MEDSRGQVLTSKYALDVTTLFQDTVELYNMFTQDINCLITKIPHYSPEQISDKCNHLVYKKNLLTSYDQQIIEVLDIAGTEIINEPIIQHYRIALADATLASNDLHQHLQEQKLGLQIQSIENLM